MQAATRPAKGSWSVPQDLSTAGEKASRPEVAIDARGDAVAVWQRLTLAATFFVDARYAVQASTRPAGGSWSSVPQDLSTADQNAYEPQVALDAQGDAVAVWTKQIRSSVRVIQASTRPVGKSWGAAEDLSSDTGNADDPRVALGGQGNAVAAWRRGDGNNVGSDHGFLPSSDHKNSPGG